MISPFDTHPAIFNRKDGSVLTISRNGVLCKDKTGKVTCDVDFDDVNGLHCSGYLNSNNNYQIIFRGTDWKNLTEVDTDCESRDDCHNIFETKALIAAFLRNKLTADFPANLDTLDLPLDYSYLKRKEVRLQNGNLVFGNTSIPIKDIRRVLCMASGTINNLLIYTSEKGEAKGFFKKLFDKADMTIPLTALTVSVINAIVARNTGHGIDFSRGNNWDQGDSKYIIIRYLDSSYYYDKDGTTSTEWQKMAVERTASYNYDIANWLEK